MNSSPINVKEKKWRFLFGLVEIDYLVEDRRPDDPLYRGKYKHYLTVKVLRTQYNWTFRTAYEYEELPYIDKRR